MTINIPSFKIPNWLKFSLLIGLGIGIVLLMRNGCGQGKLTVAEAIQFKNDIKRLVQDTLRITKEKDSLKRIYEDSLDFVNGQWLLAKNQTISTRYQLDSADKRITALIKKYVPIKIGDRDTTIVAVPSEYVQNCADCFAELSSGQEKVKQYMAQIDNLNQSYQSKINLQQNRINQLDKQNTQLAGTLQDCIEVSKAAEKKLSPHGLLFFSWSVLWLPLPKMAGIGFMYQNKYRLQIGVRGMFGQYGNGFETEVNMPIFH